MRCVSKRMVRAGFAVLMFGMMQSVEAEEVKQIDEDAIYYTMQVRMKEYDCDSIAEYLFGEQDYIKEDDGNGFVIYESKKAEMTCCDGSIFEYGTSVSQGYQFLLSSCWPALSLQSMRMEAFFPKKKLDDCTPEKARKICDRFVEMTGYPYTGVRQYVLDAEYANNCTIPVLYSPSGMDRDDEYGEWENEDSAYVFLYDRDTIQLDENTQAPLFALESPDTFVVVYNPRYGISYVHSAPMYDYENIQMQEEEILTRKQVSKYAKAILKKNGVPALDAAVVDYQLGYARKSDENSIAQIVPCWKISFTLDISDADFWKYDYIRGESASPGYVLLDAGIDVNISSFFPGD